MVSFSGISIAPETIVDSLRRDFRLREICQGILFRQIVQRAAAERGITVSSSSIQVEADRQRYERRLENAADTFAWLTEQMMTTEDWEEGICDRLLSQQLTEALFAQDVERYFAENRLNFEQVLLYKITVPYQQLSQELFYQIEEKEISFYEAAHLYDIEAERRLQCGYEGKLYRGSLKPEIASVVFGGKPGELLGPLQSVQGYDLLVVEEFIAAELNSETEQVIMGRLFQEWLEGELNYLIHHES
jgi:parvulin-like peptidyl-prolyl isomerase